MIVENRRARAKVDVILIALVLAISLVGIWAVTVATYSTSSTSDEPFINHVMETQSARRQCLFFAVGVIIIVAMMAIPYDLIKRWSVRLYVLTTAVVAFVWLVNRAQGVKQWLDILWGYTVQPTEFAKLATILMLAFLFSRSDRPMQDHHEALIVMILIGALSGIIVASGEMGSLMVILFTTLLMMWFGNVSPKLIFGIVGLGLLGVAALVGFALVTGSDSYRLQRILGFIFPEQYSSTSAYFTFNIPNTVCNDCGHIDKRYLHECPKCHSKNVDYMTRIIGYLKRVSNFSQPRQEEAARRYYAHADK